MRRWFAGIATLTMVLAVGLPAQETQDAAAADPEVTTVTITYIGNEGFLLSGGGKKVVIDGIYTGGWTFYQTPSSEVLTQMWNATGPFAGVDAVLATHNHGDHFDASRVVQHMTNNPSATLIGPAQVCDAVKSVAGSAAISNRVVTAMPNFSSSIQVAAAGMEFKVVRLRHGDDPADTAQSLGFVFSIGGVKVYHNGDAYTPNLAELQSLKMAEEHIDVAILNCYLFAYPTQSAWQIIDYLRPKAIVLMHLGITEVEQYRNIVNAITVLPPVYLMDAPMTTFRHPDGPICNLTTGQRFGLLQPAINYAQPGEVLQLSPGTYKENLTLPNKSLTICSTNAQDSAIVSGTSLVGNGSAAAVMVSTGTALRSLQGLTITGGSDGIVCSAAQLKLNSCVLTGHKDCGIEVSNQSTLSLDHCIVAGNGGAGLRSLPVKGRRILYSKVDLAHCTVAQNREYALDANDVTVANSILYGNGISAGGVQIKGSSVTVLYSDVQGGFAGLGNIDVDPSFVSSGTWTDPNTYVPGDYHLKSGTGHWDPTTCTWVPDDVTSPCIDAGDPNATFGFEPVPNGGRVNLGAYGNTAEASKSASQ
jgi:L-ascorbate metabolism protein UlaG (beta-lactamase superfamily)